ncbi:MAG: hypothetical protein MUF00_05930 [Gemmatimonadaceae bacterium]|nr:hypothetical protein [Gemmatimonadaceae bacterium]
MTTPASDLDVPFDTLFWIVLAVVLGLFIRKAVQRGGVRGVMFGSRVERLVGDVRGATRHGQSFTVSVHQLAGSDGHDAIGLELMARTAGGSQLMTVTLSREAAVQLAEHLRVAAMQ